MRDRPAPPDIPAEELRPAPLERAQTIPARWYVDPEFLALDREAVFARTWQHIADLSQLEHPGDQVVGLVAGNPVLAVRGTDGELRAFYNVCRHRGGPLALKDGRTDMLQCKYHGWTYRLDGMLRGVPHFDRVELFDKKDYGLIPVRLAVWEGLVFVNLETPGTPLETVFAGVRERLAPASLGALRFARRVEYQVRCNWKVYVDNYLEGYHVPYVHPELFSLYDFGKYATETFEWYSLQVGPLSQEENLYSAGGGEALYYHVFPNFMLNILPGRLQTNLVEPLAPDQCRVVFRYYYADATSPGAQQKIDEDLAYSDQVQREDIEICERVQLGLGSRAYDRGRFSVQFEAGVHHFQNLLREAYRTYLAAPSG